MGILNIMVLLFVSAHNVLTTEESIPPDTPTTNDLGSNEVELQ